MVSGRDKKYGYCNLMWQITGKCERKEVKETCKGVKVKENLKAGSVV